LFKAEFTQGSFLSVTTTTSSKNKRQATANLTQVTPDSDSDEFNLSSESTSSCTSSHFQNSTKRKRTPEKRRHSSKTKRHRCNFDELDEESPSKLASTNEISEEHCTKTMAPHMKLLKMINVRIPARGVIQNAQEKKLHRDALWAATELRKLASSNDSVTKTRQITLDCLDNTIKEENEMLRTMDLKEEPRTSLERFSQSRNVHEIVKNLSEAEKASELGFYLSQHHEAMSKGTIPLSMQ